MIIGILTIEIIIPASGSLKEKRFVLNSIRDRIKNKFNVAFAEIEYLDKWQRSRIGIVTLGNEYGFVEKSLRKVFSALDNSSDFEIIKYEFEYV